MTISGMLLARGVLRRQRWALAVSSVLLGAQLGGVIGSAWELIHHVNGTKARTLRRLGFAPELGVVLNLVYSAVGFAVFAWFVARWLALRRQPQRPPNDSPGRVSRS